MGFGWIFRGCFFVGSLGIGLLFDATLSTEAVLLTRAKACGVLVEIQVCILKSEYLSGKLQV